MTAVYICLIVICVLFVVVICVSNYLVSFSLDRKSKFNLESKAKKEGWQVKRPDMTEAEKFLKEKGRIVYISSREGYQLKGFLINGKTKSDKYALLIHGYGGIPEEMYPMVLHYIQKGFNCLIPVHRAHGESQGRYISMGTFECNDMSFWIDFIIKENPKAHILLHGVSMGGATVMMTCGLNLPDNVKVAVEDCGYTNVNDIFTDKLKKLFHLPSFPIMPIASSVCKIRAGFTFKQGDSIKSLQRSKIPMIFIHGSDDGFVPPYMLDILYNSCSCPKDKVVIEGANHAESVKINPKLYWEKIDAFIKNYI